MSVVIEFAKPADYLNMNDRPAVNRPRARRGAPATLFHELLTVETDECVLWPLATAKGYGRVNLRGKTESCHALACLSRNGEPPSAGLEVAHSCGVPTCMNYRHLRWATQAENMADRVIHGTSNRGERSGSHRLTETDVRVIRQRWAHGASQRALAAEYSVHETTVHCIVRRKSWWWLT